MLMKSEDNSMDHRDYMTLTSDITAAYLANNKVESTSLPSLINDVFKALHSVGLPVVEQPVKQEPAVSVRSSVKADYIVCLEDGKKLKMLKRHLMTRYGMSPDDYRAKWGLPSDYPMVAPNYAEQRRVLAVQIGLGRGANGRKARNAKPGPKPRQKAEAA